MRQYRLNKNFKIRGSKNLPVDGLTTRTRKLREEALTMKFGIFIRFWVVNYGVLY